MRFGFSLGPICNLEVIDVHADWHCVAERLTHKTGDKDGSYIVRGPCAPERRDSNLAKAYLLVLDGDHGLDTETGGMVTAPSAWSPHEALDGWQHVVTTTHSHRPEAPRWRLWMPTDRPFTREECQPITQALHARLLAAGCPVALSPESWRWSQAWFLPRTQAQPERFTADGQPVCVDDLLAAAPKEEPRTPVLPRKPVGSIDAFNATHDLEAMLLAAGYRYCGRRHMSDGTPVRAFLHPASETGIPGTYLFRSRAGKNVVLSFSGKDPLCQERDGRQLYLDAWDVARCLSMRGAR